MQEEFDEAYRLVEEGDCAGGLVDFKGDERARIGVI